MEKILSTGRCSPDDEEALAKIGREFKVDLDLDNVLRVQKALWEYDNSKKLSLVPIQTDLNLNDKEIYYNSCQCRWRLTKELPLNTAGRLGLSYNQANNIKSSDGTIFITNQRIIFVGSPKAFELNLDVILAARQDKMNAGEGNCLIVVTSNKGTETNFETEKSQAEYNCLLLNNFAANHSASS